MSNAKALKLFQGDTYQLQLLYTDEVGQLQVATASCVESPEFDTGLFPRTSDRPQNKKCDNPTTEPSKAQSECKLSPNG